MPELKCDVRNCSYNKEHACTLASIQIGGQGATNSIQTACERFAGGEYAASNEAHEVKHTVDIVCSAAGCIYNHETKCTANQVTISGAPTATINDDTECSSFWCK